MFRQARYLGICAGCAVVCATATAGQTAGDAAGVARRPRACPGGRTHHHFPGFFEDDTVRFVLPAYNAVYSVTGLPFVIERLTSSTALLIAGEAGLYGTLDGVIYVAPLVTNRGFQTFDYKNPIAVCRSSAHQFVLSR